MLAHLGIIQDQSDYAIDGVHVVVHSFKHFDCHLFPRVGLGRIDADVCIVSAEPAEFVSEFGLIPVLPQFISGHSLIDFDDMVESV